MPKTQQAICFAFWKIESGADLSFSENVMFACAGMGNIGHISVIFANIVYNAGQVPIVQINPWEFSSWAGRLSGVVPIVDKTMPEYQKNRKIEIVMTKLLCLPIEDEIALLLQKPLVKDPNQAHFYNTQHGGAVTAANGDIPNIYEFGLNGVAYPGIQTMVVDFFSQTFRAWNGPPGLDIKEHIDLEQKRLLNEDVMQCAQLCVMFLLQTLYLHRRKKSSYAISYTPYNIFQVRQALSARSSLKPHTVYDLFSKMQSSEDPHGEKLFIDVGERLGNNRILLQFRTGNSIHQIENLAIPYPALEQTHLHHNFVMLS